MSTKNASSVLLFILNILRVIVGVAIECTAIWFFVEVHIITSLRNTNHYLLDYNVYWPKAIPWLFILVGIFVICVSCCGFVGAKKKSKGLVVMYTAFQVTAIVALVAAAVVALSFDTNSTDKFIEDAILDVYTTMKNDTGLETSFGMLEKRMQCCGASGPRDYINWRREFPVSCCDTYYHGWIGRVDCSFTKKFANEKNGCTEVVTNFTRFFIRLLSGACVFTAFIGLINVIVAVTLSKSIKRRP